MAYSEYETLMMEVLVNLNNKIVPPRMPSTGDFMTPEVIRDLLDAMTYNENAKCYYSLSYVCSFPNSTSGAVSVYYFPFDMPSEYIKYTKDMIILPHEVSTFISGEYQNNPIEYLNFIEDLKLAHDLGLEPYIYKLEDGLYSTVIATRKDNPYNPLNIKSFILEDYPSPVTLHKAFGYEMPPPDAVFYPWKFSTGSHINYDNVSYAPIEIKMFKARQTMGLILKPATGQEPLPYHNVPLYYANPLYGYYEDFYDVFTFQGGGWDDNGKPLVKGHALAIGFKLVWFENKEFWITPKYKIVYSDRRPEQLTKKCCLMECFGITE